MCFGQILLFFSDYVVRKVKNVVFEVFGVDDFGEASGIYDRIDKFFHIDDFKVETDVTDEITITMEE